MILPLRAHRTLALAASLAASSPAYAGPSPAIPPTAVIDTATRALYRSECAGCHGERGDGNGQADNALSPVPRDFTRGKFKLRTTNPRQAVTVDELFATITSGVPGTAMPSFRYLSDDERRALARMVRSFGVPEGAPPGVPVAVGDPPPPSAELIAAGRQQYEVMGCAACHGVDGKGDGPAAPDLRDEWRNPAPPRNLVSEPFRGGDDPRGLYVRMAIGMPGTPMPGYAEVADSQSLWALVTYLVSIRNVPGLDPGSLRYGEQVFAARHCRACHQLAGTGGSIGPALDSVAARRTKPWLKGFLADPRPEPKVYPELPHRMPQLFLTAKEIEALIGYLAQAR